MLKMRKTCLILIFFIITLVFTQVVIAQAQWSALNSGYAITTNYHGENVQPGTLVIATAGTTDTSVKTVTFYWKYPDDTVAFTDSDVPVWTNGTKWDGKLIYYAQSSYAPVAPPGDWGVQAVFKDSSGNSKGKHSDVVAIRATSFLFFTVPEVPFGTATILLSLLGTLALITRLKGKFIKATLLAGNIGK
jgi:hypothetical protein